MDTKGFTYFAWLHPSEASHGFVASFITADGDHDYLTTGENGRGEKLFRRFKFNPSQRVLSIPNSQKDVIDFLRRHPDCDGSPNGHYVTDSDGKTTQVGAVYKEINEGKDAKIGIDAIKTKTKATNHALTLEDPSKADELKEISVMAGYFSNDPGMQHWHLLQYAANSPDRYLEIVEDPTRKAKYIIKSGLYGENAVLRKKGFMIFWQEIHLGNSFDEAVQKILSDKLIMKAIEDALNRAGQKSTK